VRDPVDAALANQEWIRIMDPVRKQPFYVHVVSKRTTWDLRGELAKEREEQERREKKANRRAAKAARSGTHSAGPVRSANERSKMRQREAAGAASSLLIPQLDSASFPAQRRLALSSSSSDVESTVMPAQKPKQRVARTKQLRPRRQTSDPLATTSSSDGSPAGRSTSSGSSSAAARHRRSRSATDRGGGYSSSGVDRSRSYRMHRPQAEKPPTAASGHQVPPPSRPAKHGGKKGPEYGSKEYFQELWDCL
jgi:hypothetical protein